MRCDAGTTLGAVLNQLMPQWFVAIVLVIVLTITLVHIIRVVRTEQNITQWVLWSHLTRELGS